MILIYIPAYNEEKNIAVTIHAVQTAVKNLLDVKILVVNDGSIDKTAKIAEDCGAIVVNHLTNYGVGSAFQSALSYALEHEIDILVSIDADGQFDPKEISNLVQPIMDGKASMVTGTRFQYGRPEYMSKIKYIGNLIVSKLVSSISNQSLHDVSCGFRAYSREALLHLNLFGEFTYTHETILDLAHKNQPIAEVPIQVNYFPDRRSRVASSIPEYAYRSGKIIFRVLIDYKALHFMGLISLFFLLTGGLCEAFLLIHYVLAGMFTPYKAFGFIGLGFIIFGLFVLLFSLIADLINRLRANQERILFYLKKNQKEKYDE